MAMEYPLTFNRKLRWTSSFIFMVHLSAIHVEIQEISPFWDRKSWKICSEPRGWKRQSNVAKKKGGPKGDFTWPFFWPRIQRVKKMMDSRCCCLVSLKADSFNDGSVKEIGEKMGQVLISDIYKYLFKNYDIPKSIPNIWWICWKSMNRFPVIKNTSQHNRS